LAVPSLGNKPRYSTPEVQLQLPTLEPTPAIKVGNRQRSSGLLDPEDYRKPLVRVNVGFLSGGKSKTEWQERQRVQEQEQAAQEENGAHEGSGDEEESGFVGPWVAKDNPVGFLDSDDEELLGISPRKMAGMVKEKLGKQTWRFAAEFLLRHVVDFVDEILVQSESGMNEYDLLLRILGVNGSEGDESQEAVSDVLKRVAEDRNRYLE